MHSGWRYDEPPRVSTCYHICSHWFAHIRQEEFLSVRMYRTEGLKLAIAFPLYGVHSFAVWTVSIRLFIRMDLWNGQIELHPSGALSFFRARWINIKEIRIIPVINFAVLKLINGNSLRFGSDKIISRPRGGEREFPREFTNTYASGNRQRWWNQLFHFSPKRNVQRLCPSDEMESYSMTLRKFETDLTRLIFPPLLFLSLYLIKRNSATRQNFPS